MWALPLQCPARPTVGEQPTVLDRKENRLAVGRKAHGAQDIADRGLELPQLGAGLSAVSARGRALDRTRHDNRFVGADPDRAQVTSGPLDLVLPDRVAVACIE